jgi:UDP-N-acetylglucosamine--N-acetylmuramyl-(pentapeptide) pyrophosphoryl-undecaprenol N-acetylglucosamine transferase
MNPKICLAGGATGGHTIAAVVIGGLAADAGISVFWVGRQDSFEARVAKDSAITFIPMAIWRLRPKNAIRILKSIHQARRIIRQEKPDLVVATGSWVCFPVAAAAKLSKVPLVVHEQTLIPGRASRFLSRLARETWISFDSSRRYFRRRKSVIYTGFPLRPELRYVTTGEQALKEFGLTDSDTLFVAGGGSGSEALNSFVYRNMPALLNRWQIIHQAGTSAALTTTTAKLREAASGLPQPLRRRYWVEDYLNGVQVNAALRGSSLVLGRAGAAFCNELRQVGTPAILVPYPFARAGEQQALAEELQSLGQAWIWQDQMLHDEQGPCLEQLVRFPDETIRNLDRRGKVDSNAADQMVIRRLRWLLTNKSKRGGKHEA